MKRSQQEELKETENKDVMLGTFSMASEGFDCKELDTIILGSPKSNIEQSIGRITRKAHNTLPIAFDIVDCFSIFINQFNQHLFGVQNVC